MTHSWIEVQNICNYTGMKASQDLLSFFNDLKKDMGKKVCNIVRPFMVIQVFEISNSLSRWFFVGFFTDFVLFNGPCTINSCTPDKTAALRSSTFLLGNKINTDNSAQLVFIA